MDPVADFFDLSKPLTRVALHTRPANQQEAEKNRRWSNEEFPLYYYFVQSLNFLIISRAVSRDWEDEEELRPDPYEDTEDYWKPIQEEKEREFLRRRIQEIQGDEVDDDTRSRMG